MRRRRRASRRPRPAAGRRGSESGRRPPSGPARAAQLVGEVAVARDRQAHAGQARQRVDEVFEALLAHQTAGREDQRRVGGDPGDAVDARAPRRRGLNRAASTPYGTVSTRSGSAPIATRAARRSSLQAVTHPARAEARPRRPPAGAVCLRDEDVRSVQADDERPGPAAAAMTPPGTTQWPCMTVAPMLAAPHASALSQPAASASGAAKAAPRRLTSARSRRGVPEDVRTAIGAYRKK